MKLIIKIYLFVFSSVIYSQKLNDSNINFNIQLNKFNMKDNDSVIKFNSLVDLQDNKQSIFNYKEIYNEKMLNIQLKKFNLMDNERVIKFNLLVDLLDNKQSILNNKEINYEKILNAQFEKFNFNLPEKKMDFNSFFFNCGVFEAINSKDMMISAFKYYILNKYVLSLFAKTDYN